MFVQIESCAFILSTLLFLFSIFRLTNSNSVQLSDYREAYPYEFPYIVKIERIDMERTDENKLAIVQKYPICAGSVLKPTWTLSAAHCADSSDLSIAIGAIYVNPYKLVVRYGSPQGEPRDDDKYSTILGLENMPGNRSGMTWDDIILFKTQPIQLKSYGRLSALDHAAMYGEEVLFIGNGCTDNTDESVIVIDSELPLHISKTVFKRCNCHREITDNEEFCHRVYYPDVCLGQACKAKVSIEECDDNDGSPVLHPSGIVAISGKPPPIDEYSYNFIGDIALVTPTSMYIDWISDVLSRDGH